MHLIIKRIVLSFTIEITRGVIFGLVIFLFYFNRSVIIKMTLIITITLFIFVLQIFLFQLFFSSTEKGLEKIGDRLVDET